MKEMLKDVAIIMDGNGRWAKSRRRPRVWGHIRGAHVVSNIAERASGLSLNSLTLYAFSTENWSRAKDEIYFLFKLLDKFLDRERVKILKNNIKFNVLGNYNFLPESTLRKIGELKELTKDAEGLKLNFAFGYGGRQEIIDATNRFIEKNPGKAIDLESLESELYESKFSDVDLIIRTGGDQRISNFLLWQSAYSELYFTKSAWPDFSENEFQEILEEVSERERRFGGVGKDLIYKKQKDIALEQSTDFKEEVKSLEL